MATGEQCDRCAKEADNRLSKTVGSRVAVLYLCHDCTDYTAAKHQGFKVTPTP